MKLKIGNVELDNNLVLAPMAGVTGYVIPPPLPGAGLWPLVTEMVSAKAISL